MFEMLLKSAFDAGGEVFVFMNGFTTPLKGRVQDMNNDYFTFFQNGKQGNVLWAFRMSDVISCGLLVGPPTDEIQVGANDAQVEGVSLNESEY